MKHFRVLLANAIVLLSFNANAVNFNVGEVRFGLNGYLDMEANWMDKMAMAMNCSVAMPCTMDNGMTMNSGQMVMNMEDQFTIDQNHLNILIGAETKDIRTHINIESRHSFQSSDRYTGMSTNGGQSGQFRIAEAYGDFTANERFRYRFGSFNAPFGLFNRYRYITPLYATVVLPFIYELPFNYNGELVTPSNGNMMVYGELHSGNKTVNYYVYANGGDRNLNSASAADSDVGRESNADKGVGARAVFGFDDKYSLGFSIYSVDEDDEASKLTQGVDLDMHFGNYQLQMEYVKFKQYQNKLSYYGRLIYNGFEKFTPFIMYDYFKDEAHYLYDLGQSRLGVGTGYQVRPRMTVKLEYHYHSWDETPRATAAMGMMTMDSSANKHNNMVRFSTIFSF